MLPLHALLWDIPRGYRQPSTGMRLVLCPGVIHGGSPTSVLHVCCQVLYLDSDCMPLYDPSVLFETPEYQQHGVIIFPGESSVHACGGAHKQRVQGQPLQRDGPDLGS